MLPANGLLPGLALSAGLFVSSAMGMSSGIIDDFSQPAPRASNGSRWELVTDGVMGGRSTGTMSRETVDGRPAVRLRGAVSLENKGGFVQLALDLAPDGSSIDARDWRGIEIDVRGNGERYGLHLRTADIARPWQSYRQSFTAGTAWETVRLPFDGFAPHRIEAPLDVGRLRRIGLIAIGRVFDADLAIAGVRFYR
jgi:hypothetical protein